MRLARALSCATAGSIILVLGGSVAAYAAVPGNDAWTDATVVTSLSFTDSSSTVEATHGAEEPSDYMTSRSIWYRYTTKGTTAVQADTQGSDFDTLLAIYTVAGTEFTRVAGDDDSGGSLTSSISIVLEPRTTYYFMVGGFGTAAGNTVFNLTGDQVSIVAPKVTAKVDQYGSVDVTITLSCRGYTGTLEAFELLQYDRQGNVVAASGGVNMTQSCGTTVTYPDLWSYALEFSSGRAETWSAGHFTTTHVTDASAVFATSMRIATQR